MMQQKSEPIADQEERKRALVPAQSFIIKAPAGSGKTGLLVQRYLKLLALVDAPEEIIAITFTRKAAAEMQNRILEALETALANEIPADKHKYDQTTFALAQAALKHNEQKKWQIIDNPKRLRLQTIDSFCASLVRQMPILSRLGTQPAILEDPEPLYQQAAINTLAELDSYRDWSDSIAALARHLDNDLPKIKTLIVTMLKKRDQWQGYVTQEHDRADMEDAIRQLIELQLEKLIVLIPANYLDELRDLLQFATKNIPSNQNDNPISACIDIDQELTAKVVDLPYWHGIAELLLTNQGSWRKQVNKNNGFPPTNKHEKEILLGLIEQLQQIAGLQQAFLKVKQLPPLHYTDSELEVVNDLCKLLTLAAAQLRLLFGEHNQMDFIGIAKAAICALGTDDEPTDLAMTLDYKIQHLLVDEYQDISISQYKLLQSLTRQWLPNDGHSLFLVGDPMQSIYRFRQAEVSLFIKSFDEKCLGDLPLQPLCLTVNFRSQKAIVDWVNESFRAILPKKDDLQSGAVKANDAIAFHQTSNAVVKVCPFYDRNTQAEAKEIVTIIQELTKKNDNKKIAILVRSRSHLKEIIPALKKADLPFSAVDIEGLETQQSIQDLLSLTRAYLLPADRIAWLACLRAPWTGLTLNSLLMIADQTKNIWECINDPTITKKLQTEEQSRLEKFTIIFNKVLENKQRLSIRQTVEIIWCQLGGPATLTKESDLKNCEQFFGLLEYLDRGGIIKDLQQLTTQVSQLYAAPEQSAKQQIQIMTIHKAKGLEFDHVIVPGLGTAPRPNQKDLLVWERLPEQQEALILAPIKATGGTQMPIYDYIYQTNIDRQNHEYKRLLYVATTRCKESLHLLGSATVKEEKGTISCQPRKRTLLDYLWPIVGHDYQQSIPAITNQSEATSEQVIKPNQRLAHYWQSPTPPIKTPIKNETLQNIVQQEQNIIEFSWAGEVAKKVGAVVHQFIQQISEQGIDQWNVDHLHTKQTQFANALKQLGVPENARTDAVKRVQSALKHMLNDERGRWILATSHTDQQNEYQLTGLYNQQLINVILDRTFIDEMGTRWIIDYKISHHEGADPKSFLDREQKRYREQLEKYATLMNQFDNKPIKLGLYFPLLKGWREWRFEVSTSLETT